MSWSGLPETVEKFIIPEPNSGCWLWLGAARSKRSRYGSHHHNGKQYLTHRLVYELLVGPIPAELQIDHLCRNRICCNPDHLEPVTIRTNLLRGETLAAANAAKTHCLHGHPLSGENLYLHPNGGRICKECGRKHALLTNRKRKQKDPVSYRAKQMAWYHANGARLRAHRKTLRDRKIEYREFVGRMYEYDARP